MNKPKGYKRILIVRLDKIGDVVLSTPVIKAVRDAYPDSHITFMVEEYAHDIVCGNPYLDSVIVYNKYNTESAMFGNIKFILKLRKMKFDLAIILHPTSRTHILAFLAGIPERVGYDKKLGFLLTRRIPHTKQEGLKHEIDYTLDILKCIGIEAKDKALYMPTSDVSEKKMGYIFTQNHLGGKKAVVTIHPAASCPSKRWPVKKFVDVGDELGKKYGASIIIIAGPEDKEFGDEVAALMKERVVNLSGITRVGDLASILKRSKLFISNDSGPVHIAAAVGTPTIAIFGRKDRGLSPKRWAPTGKKDVVLHKDVGCDICLAHECKKGFKCLEAVTVEEVVAAAGKLLRG